MCIRDRVSPGRALTEKIDTAEANSPIAMIARGKMMPLAAPPTPMPTELKAVIPLSLIHISFTVPSIDPATWQLTIGGGSRGPLTLSYADLLAREQIEIDCTLSCVSNEVGGSLVGNARWQGVELAPLLAEAGIPDGTTQVGATSTARTTMLRKGLRSSGPRPCLLYTSRCV